MWPRHSSIVAENHLPFPLVTNQYFRSRRAGVHLPIPDSKCHKRRRLEDMDGIACQQADPHI